MIERHHDVLPSRFFTGSPPFSTTRIRSGSASSSMSASGSPRTTTTSASFPGLERAELVFPPQQAGRCACRRGDRLERRHPAFHHERQLAQVAAVRTDRGVGTHRDVHARRDRGRNDSMCRTLMSRAFSTMTSGIVRPSPAAATTSRRDERRHEPRVPLLHQRDRLFVEQAAVLDARDSTAQRVLDAGGRHGVRHHPLSLRRRFLDRDR